MRAISDYNFGNSWVLAAMGLRPEAECTVTADVACWKCPATSAAMRIPLSGR